MSLELSNAEKFISWMHKKIELNAIAPNAATRITQRGQVYWCHFGLNVGSEMSKPTARPAIIVSNHSINKNGAKVVVVPVTHDSSTHPCLVPLTPVYDGNGNVILDGKADTYDIITVSKARLGDKITTISNAEMKKIDMRLSIALSLNYYYDNQVEKYNKLQRFSDQIKEDRNTAQDTIKTIKEIIEQNEFTEDTRKKIKEILDIK